MRNCGFGAMSWNSLETQRRSGVENWRCVMQDEQNNTHPWQKLAPLDPNQAEELKIPRMTTFSVHLPQNVTTWTVCTLQVPFFFRELSLFFFFPSWTVPFFFLTRRWRAFSRSTEKPSTTGARKSRPTVRERSGSCRRLPPRRAPRWPRSVFSSANGASSAQNRVWWVKFLFASFLESTSF